MLLQELDDLVMSSPDAQASGVAQGGSSARFGLAPRSGGVRPSVLAELGRPAQRSGTNVFVARVQIGAVIEEDRRFLHVALPRELMEGVMPSQSGWLGFMPWCEQKFGQFAGLRRLEDLDSTPTAMRAARSGR